MSRDGKMNDFSTLRLAAALSIPEAAKIVGVATSTAYRWEHNEVAATPAALAKLRERGARTIAQPNAGFKFIDLFAGIGGLRRGFDAIGGRCVFTSEWNKYAEATYRANYYDGPDHVFAGDITKVEAEDIPQHDVLLAGFPCQPFSIAGVSKKNSLGRLHGFRCDAQGTLFFDVARIIDHHRPKVILLENVKNLLSHDGGKTFAVIKATLEEELGYDISVRVIDARCFVPQHRERIFLAGVRRDLGLKVDLATMVLPAGTAGPRLGSILHPEDGTEIADPDYTAGGKVLAKYELSNKLWQYLQAYADKHKAKGNGFGFGLVGRGDVARALSSRYYKDGSDILIEQGAHKNPRRLTPRECARLMGFDRSNGSEFIIPVSDTAAYVQFGNATVVQVADLLAKHLKSLVQTAIAAALDTPPQILSLAERLSVALAKRDGRAQELDRTGSSQSARALSENELWTDSPTQS
jgi:DNA (cytosine-5)-methyltransferase 1